MPIMNTTITEIPQTEHYSSPDMSLRILCSRCAAYSPTRCVRY